MKQLLTVFAAVYGAEEAGDRGYYAAPSYNSGYQKQPYKETYQASNYQPNPGYQNQGTYVSQPGYGQATGKCAVPPAKGGYWTCRLKLAENEQGRKRREGEEEGEDRGAYLGNSYNGYVKECSLTCHPGWELVGSATATCNSQTGFWYNSASGYCKQLVKCTDLTAVYGSYQCSGDIYNRKCTLKCPRYWFSRTGVNEFECTEGRWNGNSDCEFVNKCQDPPRGENYAYQCSIQPCQQYDPYDQYLPAAAPAYNKNYVNKYKQQASAYMSQNPYKKSPIPISAYTEADQKRKNKKSKGRRRREGEDSEDEAQDRSAWDDESEENSYRGYSDPYQVGGAYNYPGPDLCYVCYLKCDPVHRAVSGYRAQCSLSDGKWFEKAIGTCNFEHYCYWPQAGPMGYYQCYDNLLNLGYYDHGHSLIPQPGSAYAYGNNYGGAYPNKPYNSAYPNSYGRKRREGEEEPQGEEVTGRGYYGNSYGNSYSGQTTVKVTQTSTKVTNIQQTQVVVNYAWWDAQLTCRIFCARFHKPMNGQKEAKCSLKTSYWSPGPTQCVYSSPCKTPSTPYGVFQCWEQTIPEDDDSNYERTDSFEKGEFARKRREANGTEEMSSEDLFELESDTFYTGVEDFDPFSHEKQTMVGRAKTWGVPSPPTVDKSTWNFSVKKECVLSCNDCYSPTTQRAVCINGVWLENYQPGKCNHWRHCPAEPWWDQGQGQWDCKDAGKYRTCNLRCRRFYIGAPIQPALAPPPSYNPMQGQGGARCKPIHELDNGWWQCKTEKKPYTCRVMCNEGFKPSTSALLESTCENGQMFPSMPVKRTAWGCVAGTCDPDVFGASCWGHGDAWGEFSSYLHTVGVNAGYSGSYGDKTYGSAYGRKRRSESEGDYWEYDEDYSEDKTGGFGRSYNSGNGYNSQYPAGYNPMVSLTSRCDNCNGEWANQVHCVFNTRCLDVPPRINNAYVECQRIIEETEVKRTTVTSDNHVCMVQCHENYAIQENSCQTAPPSTKGSRGRRQAYGSPSYGSPSYGTPSYPNKYAGSYKPGYGASYVGSSSQSVSYSNTHSTSGYGSTHTSTDYHKIPVKYENKPYNTVSDVKIQHEEEVAYYDPDQPGAMRCNAESGEWDSWCKCEWNLKCEVPEKPNAKYDCWDEDGMTICQLTCKGNGQFVPAKWSDTWKFSCKRGIWIGKEPQGCKYEPPCEKYKVSQAKMTNCKKERCHAPLAAYQEKMPGQRFYEQGMYGESYSPSQYAASTQYANSPYSGTKKGRKRREGEDEEDYEGTVEVDDDGNFMTFKYVDGIPVMDPVASFEGEDAGEPEPYMEDIDYDDQGEEEGSRFGRTDLGEERGKVQKNQKKKQSATKSGLTYHGFGTCMSRRRVSYGWIHCYAAGSYNPVHGYEKPVYYGKGYDSSKYNTYKQQVSYGYIKAVDTSNGDATIGKPGAPAANSYYGKRLSAKKECLAEIPMPNGYLDCREADESSVCKLRCDADHTPAQMNQFASCTDGDISQELSCVAGYCDEYTFGNSCFNVTETAEEETSEERRRRSVEGSADDEASYRDSGFESVDDDVMVLYDTDEDESVQRSLARTYSTAKPVAQPGETAYCTLVCDKNSYPAGQTQFECNSKTGVFTPAIGGCRRDAPLTKITEEVKKVVNGNVWTTCTVCDVNCKNFYVGGGHAKCVKGYWFEEPTCEKYVPCAKPNNPAHGEYTCVYEHEWMPVQVNGYEAIPNTPYGGYPQGGAYAPPGGYYNPYPGRKRRSGNETESEGSGDDEDEPKKKKPASPWRGDVWEGTEDTYEGNLRSLEDDLTNMGLKSMDGYRWEDMASKKMLCSLTCEPGYTAVQPVSICVDGTWVIPPSYCKQDYKCQPPMRDPFGQWYCRVEQVGGSYYNSGGYGGAYKPTYSYKPSGYTAPSSYSSPPAYGAPSYPTSPAYGRRRRAVDEHGFSEVIDQDEQADRDSGTDYEFSDYIAVDASFNLDGFRAVSEDADEGSNRWEQYNTRKMLVCTLSCFDGTYGHGSSKAMCDLETGFWYPKPGKCSAFDGYSTKCAQPYANYGSYQCSKVYGAPKPYSEKPNTYYYGNGIKATYPAKQVYGTCPIKTNVSGGFVTCEKQGYGFFCQLMCNSGYRPATSQTFSGCSNGKFYVNNFHCQAGYCDPTVYKQSCYGYNKGGSYSNPPYGRKRRDTSELSDAPEDLGDFGSTWAEPNTVMGRYSSSHLVCDLNCSPGYTPQNGRWVAKCDEQSGTWLAPPTHCSKSHYNPQCNQKYVNGGYLSCGYKKSGTAYTTSCQLHCFDGFVPRDPYRTTYQCNYASGAFTPQPIGCKVKTLPSYPEYCKEPAPIPYGSWKCYLQDYDAPYPSASSRTENWDQIETDPAPPRKGAKKIGKRRRRDLSGADYYSDEVEVIGDQLENKHTKLSKKQLGRSYSYGKPQNYICLANCDNGYAFSGSYIAVCRVPTGQWLQPPAAFCNKQPPANKYCYRPQVNYGYYICEEDNYSGYGGINYGLMRCNLRCNPGYRPANGRWEARCDQNNGIWQIPATNCVPEVATCQNVPSLSNGDVECEDYIAADTNYMKSETDDADKKPVEAVKTTARPKITVPTPDPSTLVGATGTCDLSPAVNEVKGGLMDCRESSSGQVLCMIKCAENFRPWHGELIIVCRNGVYYNRKNPLEVQKNMKCKEAKCDPDKYGIACFNHPKNRQRREGEFERALRTVRSVEEERGKNKKVQKNQDYNSVGFRRCTATCKNGYVMQGSTMAICNMDSGIWEVVPGTCMATYGGRETVSCVAPQALDNGKWKCKLTTDEGDMRGEEFVEISEDEAEEFNNYNKQAMSEVAERGLWDIVPDHEARKRRSTDSQWGSQIARFASTTYLVCQMKCNSGFVPKQENSVKIGCRQTDTEWIKPFSKNVHQCVPEPPPPPPVKEVVDQCARRPGKVKNGSYKDCEEKDGKVMCRLQCKAGHIPDGKAKWACKNGVVTSPATGCVKLQVPERQADCTTPTVNNGQYVCNWSVACIDETLGKACVRKCKLKCDAGFEALNGMKDAVCLRSSKIWVKPVSVCVPENFENDGSVVIEAPEDVEWKGEFDDVSDIVAEIEAAIAPTEAPTEAPTAAPTEAPTPAPEEDRAEFDEEAADRAEKEKKKKDKKAKKDKKKKDKKAKKDKKKKGGDSDDSEKDHPDCGWGYGTCPSVQGKNVPSCLPSTPVYDQGKEKLSESGKVGWNCMGDGVSEGTRCFAICGPSAVRAMEVNPNYDMECACRMRKDVNGQIVKMCTWKGKIKTHCNRMMCPPLRQVQNGQYIATSKADKKQMQRARQFASGEISLAQAGSVLQARWGKEFKSCPTGVAIPKSKVECTLQCDAGFVLGISKDNSVKKTSNTKASCSCKVLPNAPKGYACAWQHKADVCIRPEETGKTKTKKTKKTKA